MTSPLFTNPSVVIKVEPEDLDPIKTEQDSENEEMETEEHELPLPTKEICERIVRKLLASGKKYCSVCYGIFQNWDDLSTHLTTPSGCHGYSEEDLNGFNQSTVDFVNDFMTHNGDSYSSVSSSSSSSSSSSTSIVNEPPEKRTKTTAVCDLLPSSRSNDNNNKNNNSNNNRVDSLYKCPFCPITAPNSKRLESHIRLHITGGHGAYFCPLCPQPSDADDGNGNEKGLVFATAHDWLCHVKRCHCKWSKFRDQYSILKLSRTPQENSFKEGEKCPHPPRKIKEKIVLVCSDPGCKKVYITPWTFKYHCKVHEGEIVEYCCVYPECPDAESKKSWGDLKQFQQHMTQHQNQRLGTGAKTDWLCTVPDCFRRLFQVKSYMQHVLGHMNRTVSCSFCPRKFMTEYSMKKHEELHQIVNEADEEENQDDMMMLDNSSDPLLQHENFVP